MFNGFFVDFYEGLIDAVEQFRCLIIIGVVDRFVDRFDFEMIVEVMIFFVKRVFVLVCVYFDYVKSLKNIIRVIKVGFIFVMFDGLSLLFEENIKRIKEIVEIVYFVGVSVEGEFGVVGRGDWDFKNLEFYIKFEEVEIFAVQINVDVLVVVIGIVYGVYKGQLWFDFERFFEIRKRVDCYFVFYGGFGFFDDDFRKCIEFGINKVNIFIDLILVINFWFLEFVSKIEDLIFVIFERIREIVCDEVIKKFKVFGSYDIIQRFKIFLEV